MSVEQQSKEAFSGFWSGSFFKFLLVTALIYLRTSCARAMGEGDWVGSGRGGGAGAALSVIGGTWPSCAA